MSLVAKAFVNRRKYFWPVYETIDCPWRLRSVATIRTYNMGMSSAFFIRLASIAVLIAIWVLSLLPGNDLPRLPGIDKWFHGLAYFACMFCWGQWFTRPVSRLKIAIAFIVMGALIECLQGLTSYRSFDWLDMVANAAGVVLAWLAVTVQLAFQRRFAPDHKSTRPR